MFTPISIDSRNTAGKSTLNFQSMNVEFLGSRAICLLISAIEIGMIVVLFSRFLARRRESWAIQLLVYFVTAVAFLQMGATFALWWRISVLDFGDWAAVSDLKWPDKIHFELSSFIAAPVQLFYIWRCWHVSLNRRPYIAFFLVLLVIGSVATEIYIIVIMCLVDWKSSPIHLLARNAFYICSILSVTFSTVTDFCVTAILLVFLIRSRSNIHAKQFRETLYRLTLITWESAVPPCTCAIATLIACAVSGPIISNWGLMLQAILGKLYVISLFMTLEGRAMMAVVADRTHFLSLSGTNRNIARWSVRPGELHETQVSNPSDLPLQFKVMSSDPGAEESGSFDPETTGATEPQTE